MVGKTTYVYVLRIAGSTQPLTQLDTYRSAWGKLGRTEGVLYLHCFYALCCPFLVSGWFWFYPTREDRSALGAQLVGFSPGRTAFRTQLPRGTGSKKSHHVIWRTVKTYRCFKQ